MKNSSLALLLTRIQGCDNSLRFGFKGFEFLAVRPDAEPNTKISTDLTLPASDRKCGNLAVIGIVQFSSVQFIYLP